MQQQELHFEAYQKPIGIRQAFAFASTLGNAKAQRIVIYVVASFIIVCSFATFAMMLASDSAGPLLFLFFFLLVPSIFVIQAIRSIIENATRTLRLSQFASANGLTFLASRPTGGYPGMIFSTGTSPQYMTVVNGTYKNLPFEFGNFYCTVGSGKSSRRLSFGVIEVKLTRKLPHILLDSLTNNKFGFTYLPQFKDSQHLTLEGNFNDYFNLYVPDGYERDALYFITPELMALLIDQGAGYDIEIIDDRLYIYSVIGFTLENQATLEQIFKLIGLLGGEVQENTGRYADAQIGNRQANIVADPGRRLKKRTPWLAIAFSILFAIAMFALGMWVGTTPTPAP